MNDPMSTRIAARRVVGADQPPELFKDVDDCDLVVRALAGLSERCREC